MSKFSTNVEKFIKFDKIKIYVVDENEKKTIEYSFENENDEYLVNYYTLKDLDYYERDFYNESKKKFAFYLVASNVFSFFVCRRCENIFSSNNKFHQHVKIFCSNVRVLLVKSNLNFFANAFKFTFIIKTTRAFSFIDESKIIIFNVDSTKNVNIEFEFRD